jgi:D-alanine-D-alanine ligase
MWASWPPAGGYASDGCLQGLLEMMGIAYTGSGVFASALAMNQAKCKDVLRLHNLPTAPAYVIRADAVGRALGAGPPRQLRLPGGGVPRRRRHRPGLSLASDELELEAAVDEAFRCGDEVLVERLVDGRVFTVAVLDGTPLGALDPRSLVGLLDGRARRGEARGERAPMAARKTEGPVRRRPLPILLRIAQQSCEALGARAPSLVELTVSDRLNEVVRSRGRAPVLGPASTFARIAALPGWLRRSDRRGPARARLKAHGQRRERRTLQVAFTGPERRNGLQALPH